MTKFTSLLASAAMAVGLASPVLADSHEPLQIGFVYVGSVGDLGWTYEHDQSRQAVEAHFGDAVTTTYVENVPEGADAERVMS
jgi:basic membrane protein A